MGASHRQDEMASPFIPGQTGSNLDGQLRIYYQIVLDRFYTRRGTGDLFDEIMVIFIAHVPGQENETVFHGYRETVCVQSADFRILANGVPDFSQDAVIGI